MSGDEGAHRAALLPANQRFRSATRTGRAAGLGSLGSILHIRGSDATNSDLQGGDLYQGCFGKMTRGGVPKNYPWGCFKKLPVGVFQKITRGGVSEK